MSISSDFLSCPSFSAPPAKRRSPRSVVGEAGSRNFPTDSSKFPTDEIMSGQNVIFALKFFKEGGLALNVAFLDKTFPTRTKFSDNFSTV